MAGVVAPILERWRWIAATCITFGVVAVGYSLSRPRQFEAAMTVAAASGSPSISLSGAASILSGGGLGSFQTGLQPSPGLVVSLIRSQRVLESVGASRVGSQTLINALAEKPVPPADVAGAMGKRINTDIQQTTGFVAVKIVSRDSGLARLALGRLIDQVSRTYVDITRAQAAQVRLAQQQRVDSASRQLRRAEDELVEFNASNRFVQPLSSLAVTRDRLERSKSVAQEVYSRAVADRESAVAKELDATPALVLIDPIPSLLPKVSRNTGVIGLLAVFGGLFFSLLAILFAETVRHDVATVPEDYERLAAALPFRRRAVVKG